MSSNIASYTKYRMIYYSGTLKIKGRYDITSYDENNIMLRCAGEYVYITGDKLEISNLDCDEICINGKISDISIS